MCVGALSSRATLSPSTIAFVSSSIRRPPLSLPLYQLHGLRAPIHHRTGLPYDRERTTMITFTLCPPAARNTRTHGIVGFTRSRMPVPRAVRPFVSWRWASSSPGDAALVAAARAVAEGRIVAVKGVGGFFLPRTRRRRRGPALRARKQGRTSRSRSWDGTSGIERVAA